MQPSPGVTEDRGDASFRQPSNPRWLWFAGGLVSGIGLALLLVFAQPSALPGPTVPTLVAESADSGIDFPGLGAAVPGFPDGLGVVNRTDGLSLEWTIWPVAGASYSRAIPVGSGSPAAPVVFDSSSRRMATVVDGSAGPVLYAGVPERAHLVAVGVTGIAWHDTEPAVLAYSTPGPRGVALWVVDGEQDPRLAMPSYAGPDAALAAWGEWGWAIQEPTRVVVLDPAFGVVEQIPGRLLGSSGDGRLIVDSGFAQGEGDVDLWSFGGPPVPLAVGEEIGWRRSAVFSPSGEAIAVLGSEGVVIVTTGGEAVAVAEARVDLPGITWTSGGEFVVFPGFRGVLIVDSRTGRITSVLDHLTVTGVATVPVDLS